MEVLEVVTARGRRVLALAVVFVLALGVGVVTVLLTRDDRQPSAEPVIEVDDLDCVTGIHANTDFALDGDDGGDLVVCRYDKLPQDDSSGQSHELASSSTLSAAESARVRHAVGAAPRGEPPFHACEDGDDQRGEFFLVRTPTQVAYWVDNASCGENGVLVLGPRGKVQRRHPTAELMAALGSSYGPLGPTS